MEAGARVSTLDESAIVERVARLISSVRGIKPDYTRLAAELAPAIAFDVFGVVLLRHDREAVRVTVCRREGDAWVADYHQHPLADSKVEQMLHTPVTLVASYPEGASGPPGEVGDALSGHPQLRSTVVVPLMVDNRVLGTLELGSVHAHTYEFTPVRRLIEAVAPVLAAAIDSVQTGGNVEIQDRQRQALKNVSSALTSTMDLTTILERLVVGVAETLHVAAAVVMREPQVGGLHLKAQSGLDAEVLGAIVDDIPAAGDNCIIGYSLNHRQPMVSNDIGADLRFPASYRLSTELNVRSIFVYPLVTGATVYGSLLLCSPEPGGFTPLKADILSLFASQATIAIHNGMLLEAARQRQRFQVMIEQLEEAHRKSSEESEHLLLERVRQEAEQVFGVSFANILRFISDHLLTRPEQNLQAILQEARQTEMEVEPGERERMALTVEEAQVLEARSGSVAFLTQRAQEALERASILSELSRLSQIHERIPGHVSDAWFAVDLSGCCIYMNPAAEGLCGFRMRVGDSRPVEEVFAGLLLQARDAEALRAYLRAFSGEQEAPEELRCVFMEAPLPHKQMTGKRRSSMAEESIADHYYLFTRHPMRDQDGQIKAHALQVHDITEQVRDEKNRSALLSSVSHELRTPLTSIKAAVTGLLQPDVVWDEEVRREVLEEVDIETDHLTVLVNALIELSRIQMGALNLEREWCDVAELVNGMLKRIERVLAGRQVRTHFRPPLPLLALVDYVQLERVFYNLLENATRHSSEDAEISIELEIVDGVLWGRVIDPGYEVSAEERERLFTTFYSTDSQGNGLGLAICRGIIEAHHGRIWVEEATGGGACFVFTLPTGIPGPAGSLPSSSAIPPEEHT